jgi:hypothetical protein
MDNHDHASGTAVDVKADPTPPRTPFPRMTPRQRDNARFSFVLGLVQPRVYEGTVPRAEKERRRAKNRVARKARAQQRRRS